MTAAQTLEPILSRVLGETPCRITLWDGSALGPPSANLNILIRNRRALRRLLWEPSALGLARAYVAGELDVIGDLAAALDSGERYAQTIPSYRRGRARNLPWQLLGVAARLGAIGINPRPPAIEAKLAGHRHTRRRDADAIRHHYDLGNDFYRLVLGESMIYSCAYWESDTLTDAQFAKCTLIASKLGLRAGIRLLDVGCGWGTFALFAARTYGAEVVGITLSEEQARFAQHRMEEGGVADHVEIRVQDYRDVSDVPFDAIASVGMAEHVGKAQLTEYAATLAQLLAPGGRVLNHAIARPRFHPGPTSEFIDRYIFPDGELVPLSHMMREFEDAGLEIRDVESLRDHYGPTLRAWATNLDDHWAAACKLVGTERARAWLLYLTGSALAFERARLAVHQLVAIRPNLTGESGMHRSRAEWLGFSRSAH